MCFLFYFIASIYPGKGFTDLPNQKVLSILFHGIDLSWKGFLTDLPQSKSALYFPQSSTCHCYPQTKQKKANSKNMKMETEEA